MDIFFPIKAPKNCSLLVFGNTFAGIGNADFQVHPVTKGFKIADIDPRKEELQNCFTISDKARCIAGSVLEVICGELE